MTVKPSIDEAISSLNVTAKQSIYPRTLIDVFETIVYHIKGWVGSHFQESDPTLTALAGLDGTAGLLEQAGPDAFTRRSIGTASSASVPTLGDADGRYARLSASSTVFGGSLFAPIVHCSVPVNPEFRLSATANAVDQKKWQMFASSGSLIWRTLNDAENSADQFMTVSRSGSGVTDIAFASPTVTVSGTLTATGRIGPRLQTEYTVAGLPAASANAGRIAIVTDGASGRWEVRSNGTNWKFHDGSTAA